MKVTTIRKWIWIICIGSSLSAIAHNKDDFSTLSTPHFCGETLPLEKTKVSQKFLYALKHTFVRSLPRIKQTALAHFKIIEPILVENDIPDDFKYLCLIESTFSATATSYKGASGYWQFMPETAKSMGLRVDKNVDERRHLIKSTWAACRYFKYLYAQLGSWTSVAAAYNAGIGRVYDYMRRAKSMDYYDWHTNAETGQYLYRLVAVKEWFDSPIRYNQWINSIAVNQHKKQQNKPVDKLIVEIEIVEDSSEVFDNSDIGIAKEFFEQNSVVDVNAPVAQNAEASHVQWQLNTMLKMSDNVPQKGQIWVFEVTENVDIDKQKIEIGDRLYATVEFVDKTANTVTLSLVQLYSPRQHVMYQPPVALNKLTYSIHNLGKEVPAYWTK